MKVKAGFHMIGNVHSLTKSRKKKDKINCIYFFNQLSVGGWAKVQVTGHCFTNTESIPNTCKS